VKQLVLEPIELQTLAAIGGGPVGQTIIGMLQRHQASLEAEARTLDAPAVFRNLGAVTVLVEIAAAIRSAHDTLEEVRRKQQAHAIRTRSATPV
jgi:hypothetical protein